MDFMTLLQNFGLPVATAAFFIWMYVNQAKEHKQDLKDIAIKSVQAIDASTEAIKDSTNQLQQNNDALRENSNIIAIAKDVVLTQKGRRHNELGHGN